jgi:hypothetical protein
MARLSRWVIYCLWRADSLTPSPGPKRVKSSMGLWLLGDGERDPEPPVGRRQCPVDAVEGGITDLCVRQLPQKLREAVIVSYLTTGTVEDKARDLGCDRATYFRRLNRAYAEMLGLFNDHEAGVQRVDIDEANEALDAKRTIAPACAAVNVDAKLERPAMHGISHAIRVDLAPAKKAASNT